MHTHPNDNVTPIDPLARRRAAAKERVKAALDCIEEAQRLLGRACAALCSVQGMNPQWQKVSKRYDHVHGTWYEVKEKAAWLRAQDRLVLDHEPDGEGDKW